MYNKDCHASGVGLNHGLSCFITASKAPAIPFLQASMEASALKP